MKSKYLSTASTLAQQAAKLILEFQNKPLDKQKKEDNSPVTAADLAADKLIREGLAKAFPEHAILTEESGLSGNTNSEFVWVVDPLDGTKAFAKKIPGFCVMIGLLKAGQPYLGVVADPLDGHVYEAVKGEGVFHSKIDSNERTKRHVSNRSEFSQMPLVISTNFPEAKLKNLTHQLHCPVLAPINSVGIKVGLLVRQKGDIYVNHHGVHYWDTCAPQVILEEAGGQFTFWDGSSLRYDLDGKFQHSAPTLATNGVRHEELVEVLKKL